MFSQKEVIRAMKNTHPIGIPHSIFLENLFDKTFDKSKLEEDGERVRDAYQQKGYWEAKAYDPDRHPARHRRIDQRPSHLADQAEQAR